MELEVNERSEAGKKKKIRVIGGIFFGILLLFTFFSNTLLSLTLPKVLLATPSGGSINHIIAGSGMLIPLESAELKSDIGWKVKTVHVKNGDSIVKGQALITFDSKAAELQILDEQMTLKQQKMQLEGLFDSYVGASKNGDPMLIKAARRGVDIQKLQIEAHERSIQTLQDALQSNRQMLAPFSGIVTKINAMEGVPSPTINLSNASKGFRLSVALDANLVSLLSIGEAIEVTVKGHRVEEEAKTVNGVITEIQGAQSEEPAALAKESSGTLTQKVSITVQDAELKGGESASIELFKSIPTDEDTVLVAKAAIHEDPSGKYVLLVTERKGTLGNGFYVRKSNIKIVDSNESIVAVQGGIYPGDQVIIESSEPLQQGDRVRL